MKNGIFLILIFYACIGIAQTDDSISLKKCQQEAIRHFPLLRQQDLHQQANALRQQNIRAAYLPALHLNGQATYQSEVIQFPFTMPGAEIPELPKERWQVSLDIQQPLYTGGSKALRKDLEDQQLAIDLQQQEIHIQQLKPMVQQSYFAILLARQSEEILSTTRSLLQDKVKSLEAGVRGGVALPADLLRLRAEISKVEQQISEVRARQEAAYQVLSTLTGLEIGDQTDLTVPDVYTAEAPIQRPELQLFQLQSQQLNVQSQLIGTQRRPQISAFAQGGIGYPNPLNFFDDGTSPYYQAGLRLQWKLMDWGQTQREQQQINLQQQVISTEEENLERNIHIQLEQQEAHISRFEQLLAQDEEIIRLQEEIRQYASRQLDRGVITSTDYLDDVHAEQSARLNHSLHRIQLIQAQVTYLTEKGLY